MTPYPPAPPRGREPILFAPTALLVLIAVMVALHAWRSFALGLFEGQDLALLDELAFVPARFALLVGLTDEASIRAAAAAGAPALQELRLALYGLFVAPGHAKPWTLATYALLHGSWEHVIVNGVWMLAFGSPVMERFGVLRFAAFFVSTAAAAAAFQALLDPTDVSVLIGASGAVSGLTAAALRFAIGPGLFGNRGALLYRPAAPLREALRERNVLVFIVVWFAINLFAGLGAPLGGDGMRIAWEAHVGGFVAGLALFALFDPVRDPPSA
jgi:membrane associated rhomboid family serine protease